jgi:hypothetical protein
MSALRSLILLTGTLAATIALAQDASCSQSQGAGGRTACLDSLTRQQSHCFSILDTDAKNLCMAQVRQQKSYCFSIRSSDLKNICFDVFK